MYCTFRRSTGRAPQGQQGETEARIGGGGGQVHRESTTSSTAVMEYVCRRAYRYSQLLFMGAGACSFREQKQCKGPAASFSAVGVQVRWVALILLRTEHLLRTHKGVKALTIHAVERVQQ